MNSYLQELLLLVITFIFVFLLYQFFVIKKAKRKNIKKRKEPIEVSYLVNRYNLDIKKVNYNRLLLVISLVSSFDIALVVSIIMLINNFILEIIIGFVSTLIIILVSYHLVYLYYKKKGMIKNESKRNRS